MKQHDREQYVDYSKMSEAELIMHHFRQFDHDKDGQVDGLEVLKQIQNQNGQLNIRPYSVLALLILHMISLSLISVQYYYFPSGHCKIHNGKAFLTI